MFFSSDDLTFDRALQFGHSRELFFAKERRNRRQLTSIGAPDTWISPMLLIKPTDSIPQPFSDYWASESLARVAPESMYSMEISQEEDRRTLLMAQAQRSWIYPHVLVTVANRSLIPVSPKFPAHLSLLPLVSHAPFCSATPSSRPHALPHGAASHDIYIGGALR